MTRILDESFLTVHPRTALWWEQREQCRQCKHRQVVGMTRNSRGSGPMTGGQWSCLKVGGGGGENGSQACINAREEGMACGPNAELFEALA